MKLRWGIKWNKKKLILVLSLVIVVALTSFMMFRKAAVVRGGIPEWVPANLQAEIKSLDTTNPQVKSLISEIQSIHVKDPKNPPQDLIIRIENEIADIQYQESKYVPSNSNQPTADEKSHLKDVPTFPTDGKPYRLITPDTKGEDFSKCINPSDERLYDFTSVVILPYADLMSGAEKLDQSDMSPGMKGDPNTGIIEYSIFNPKTGEEICDTAKFSGTGSLTAVKVVGTTVYYQCKNGGFLEFDTSFPISTKLISQIPQ
jgi:hypothetical protein